MSQDYDDEYDARDDTREAVPDPYAERPQAGSNPQMLPGVFMIITGVLNLLLALGGIMMGVAFSKMPEAELQKAIEQQGPEKKKQLEDSGIGPKELRDIYVYGGGGGGALWLVCSLISIAGGAAMCARKARGFAMFAAIVTLAPCITSPCCLVGTPVGIWALISLRRP